MKRNLLLSLFLLVSAPIAAISQPQTAKTEFNLGFEKIADKTKLPDQWYEMGSGYTLKFDTTEKKSGDAAVLMQSPQEKVGSTFGSVAYTIPTNYEGKEIELKGYLKFKDVTDGFAGLFLRVDGEGRMLQFDNMQSRQ